MLCGKDRVRIPHDPSLCGVHSSWLNFTEAALYRFQQTMSKDCEFSRMNFELIENANVFRNEK